MLDVLTILLAISAFWCVVAALAWTAYRLTASEEAAAVVVLAAVTILAVGFGYSW